MPEFVVVAQVGDIDVRSSRAFTVGKYEVAIFHVDGNFYALEDACPHQGGPLSEGFLEGTMVTCPWHAWCFDVRSGKMSLGDFAAVPRFEVRVEGNSILVRTEPTA
ncbi:MAG: Rieske 2Fe-2S domain-containing protein [Candidatus Eremiobacteraeota bacterium]|nr:Rieske 2Fe-2S domain-containing protein [Candidatus Eremiobacteraeota bacterium]